VVSLGHRTARLARVRLHNTHRRSKPRGRNNESFVRPAGLALTAGPAPAQTYVSLGYGGVQCSTWNARKPIEARYYEAWIFGFISSYNAFVFSGPNVVEGADTDELRNWVDGYCKQNPQGNLDTVVKLLIDEYAKKQSAAPVAPKNAQDGG
jgi:hypothetical protein